MTRDFAERLAVGGRADPAPDDRELDLRAVTRGRDHDVTDIEREAITQLTVGIGEFNRAAGI